MLLSRNDGISKFCRSRQLCGAGTMSRIGGGQSHLRDAQSTPFCLGDRLHHISI